MSDPILPPSPCQIHAQQRELNRPAMLSEASTPSQGTTVSTLNVESSLVDLPVVSGVGEDTTLLPLMSIFHCPFIEENANIKTGKKGWICKWCGKMFSPRHHSRAIRHVLKIKLGDIATCTSSISRSMRIDTMHCTPEARNEWHQRSARIHRLMMLWLLNKH
jgi:hypothetical protein